MAAPNPLSSRVPFRVVRPAPRLRLLCLPFAGGGALAYRSWSASLPEAIEVCPVELPGRGARFREPHATSMRALVDDLVSGLAPLLDLPVAVFGHSMGARIALELARRREANVVHLFASASPAPHVDRASRDWSTMSDADLLAELRAWGGTPPEALQHRELMELALPILRSDLALVETYDGSAEPTLDCGVTALAGARDRDIPVGDVRAWADCTGGSFELVEVDGGHFFLSEPVGQETIFSVVARSLLPWTG